MDLNQLTPEQVVELGHLLAEQAGYEFQKVASDDLPDLNSLSVEEFIAFAQQTEAELIKSAAIKDWVKAIKPAAKDVAEGLTSGFSKAKGRFKAPAPAATTTMDKAKGLLDTAKGDASHAFKALKGELGPDAARRSRTALGAGAVGVAIPSGILASKSGGRRE